MNQIINHTEKQVAEINPVNVAATIKGIAPRSFEKTFSGLSTEQVAYAFKLCLDGLTRKQVELGMIQVRDNGYCPDPAMFRKWCLGIKGFTSDVDPIHASYRSKNAALANIEAWLSDCTTKITNAEREAYNRCYGMFNDLKWNYSDKQKFHTYLAFKDFYDEVVKELVQQGVSQSIWVEPPKIEDKSKMLLSYNINYVKSDFEKGIYVYSGGIVSMNDHEFTFTKKDVLEFSKLNGISYDDAERKIISRQLKVIRDKQLLES